MTLIAALAGVAALVLKFVRRTKRRVITFNDVKNTPRPWPQQDGDVVHGRLPMMGQTSKWSNEARYVNPKDVWVPSELEKTMVRVEVPVGLEKGLRRMEVHTAQIDIQQEFSTDPEYRLRDQTLVKPEPEPTQSEDAALGTRHASEPHKAVCTFPHCGKTFAKQYELKYVYSSLHISPFSPSPSHSSSSKLNFVFTATTHVTTSKANPAHTTPAPNPSPQAKT